MAEKLKLNPCHYCGNEDVRMTVHCFGEHLLFKIKCGKCHSGSNIEIKNGETFELMEKAVERLISVWNRRADNEG